MNQNNRFCTQVGHDKVQITHKCIFEDCNLLQRLCCNQCINEGIHNHGKSVHDHIRLEPEIQNNYQKVPKLEDDKNIKPLDFSKRQYNLKQIDYAKKIQHGYNTAQISNNEKYLAYGGTDQILKIYDIKEDKIIKEIKFNRSVNVCQFTFDSAKLYVGCIQDFAVVQCYDVRNNFKKIFSQIIKYRIIYNILTIQNKYVITFGYGKSIIKTDIKRKKQIFKLIGHYNQCQIQAIDYNLQFDYMISGSKDKSLKLWDSCKRRLIMQKEQAHSYGIFKVQLISMQNVLSLDNQLNLFKWKLDFNKNVLIKLQEYINIFSFCQINQNQNLLLIYQDYVKILDQQDQVLTQIEHQGTNEYSLIFTSRQLDNGKYIYILTYSKIMLAQTRD